MKNALGVCGVLSIFLLQNLCFGRSIEELKECGCVQEFIEKIRQQAGNSRDYADIIEGMYSENRGNVTSKKSKKIKAKGKKEQRRRESESYKYGDDNSSYDYNGERERSSLTTRSGKGRRSQQMSGGGFDEMSERDWRDDRSSSYNNSNNRNRNDLGRSNRTEGNMATRRSSNRTSSSNDDWQYDVSMLKMKYPFDVNAYKSYGLFAQNGQTDKTTSNAAENITDQQLQSSENLKAKQIDKPKYRISEKEAIKFRQELEKYKRALTA